MIIHPYRATPMTTAWVWAFCSWALLTGASRVRQRQGVDRDYTHCWKPCLFAFCKPVCPETTTTTTTTTSTQTTTGQAPVIPPTAKGPEREKTNPNRDEKHRKGTSTENWTRFARGWIIICIVLLIFMCIVENHNRITTGLNRCCHS